MLEKGKISAFQMGMMMYPTILATAILVVPGITEKYAKNDMWLSPIIASFAGFITVYLTWKLHELYPKQTVIQYNEKIIGKFFGKILSLFYVFFYIQISGIVIREFSEFIKSNFLLNTPLIVMSSSITILSAFAIRGGIEVVARIATIFTPLFFFSISLLLLLIPDLDVGNLFPFLDNGLLPVIKGGIVPQSWFSEFFLISFLLPFLTNKKRGLKSGMFTSLFVMLGLVYTNFFILTLLGGSSLKDVYPVLTAFRYISFGDFFENFEAAIMAAWVLGNFLKISVFFYVTSLAFGQWLNLSDYRPMVFPLGILIILFSYWGISSVSALEHFVVFTDSFFLFTVQTIIPFLLLTIALIRKGKNT
jgi:spore germination protein KB